MELPGRMEVQQKLGCPHCRKPLPEFSVQEILESKEYPLRCEACRKVVELPEAYIERVRMLSEG